MLLLAGVFRLVVVHLVTFFINSLAHKCGKHPYTDKHSARDKNILAFFTFGEGYHNFHHIFEYDYRNGVKWWQFDPTKWLIKGLSIIGWASNLRRTPEERIEKAKAAMQLKLAQEKVSKLANADEILAKVQVEYELLAQRMTDYYAAKKQLMAIKKQSLKRSYENLEVHYRYKELKQSLAIQKQKWLQINQFDFLPAMAE